MDSQPKKDCTICKLFKNVFIFTFGVIVGIIGTVLFTCPRSLDYSPIHLVKKALLDTIEALL